MNIIKRDDGLFVVEPEEWIEDYDEGQLVLDGWMPIPHRQSYFDSVERAEQDARTEFSWLAPQP